MGIPCGMCARRADELEIVTAQLRESKAAAVQLEAQLRSANAVIKCVYDTIAAQPDNLEAHGSQRALEELRLHEASRGDSSSGVEGTFRASAAFPFRYVPPVDFLPEEFVEAHAELLAIIDGFAQVFHRHHVGGTQTNVNDAARECSFLRSRVSLLEAQLRSAKKEIAASGTRENLTASAPSESRPFPRRGQPAFPSDSSHASSDADADLTTAPSSPAQRKQRDAAAAAARRSAVPAGGGDAEAQRARRLQEWRIRRAEVHRQEAAARPREL
eukprot:CAMPEP_0174831294 /NCGR_PEP_ID=MMETSP1114-20130205/3011_1 /TAXON_ID=312471 /ORGANISM="Neobodo designis, Strain CCAP 1951/1" /LENGTH=271 /DNA_ID=CAMNT_0016065115 /DNA_START=47 /DNA_END=859 /DNA_ORIENTATION=+